jgi:hypothetical protein
MTAQITAKKLATIKEGVLTMLTIEMLDKKERP